MGVGLQHPSAVRNGIWSEGEDGLHILRVALACSILLHSLVSHGFSCSFVSLAFLTVDIC